jgi:hypothetical protein
MDVISTCSLRVGSILWRPRPSAFMLTVVCKATFVLLPGASVLAREQDAPNEADDHWNDDERRSLHAANDLVPFKRRADVILVGHAYAPRMQPVSWLTARLIVGEVDKAVEVHADRLWTQQGELREGARFTKMPLRYERAGGGAETSNPVGIRAGAWPDMYGQITVPNLLPPGFHVKQPGEVVPPVGFGPIAPGWPTRSEKLHRHAAGWDHRRWNDRPLPEDIDAGFFNAAPADQQVGELRSDERIVLENLHPEHKRLVTSLPGMAPRAMVERAGAAAQEVRLRCDTLCIDTDRGVCNLVWRGHVVLSRADEVGRVVITAEGGGQDEAVTTIVGGLRAGAVTPFEGARSPAASAHEVETTIPMVVPGARSAALPFREVSPWEGPPAMAMSTGEAMRRADDEGTGTVLGGMRWSGETLPFVGYSDSARPAAEAVATPMPAPSFVVVEQAPVRRVEPETVAPAEAVAPPPMIGPLARAEMAEKEAVPEQEEAAPTAPMAPVVALPVPEPGVPLEQFPIERCAAIAASTARRREARSTILEENELTPERWGEIQDHWAREIRAEIKRGKTLLLKAYDVAYVAQLEKERGPIRPEEYARLVVATERDSAEEEITALGLPRGALMRIQRLWLDRIAGDPELGKAIRAAIEQI